MEALTDPLVNAFVDPDVILGGVHHETCRQIQAPSIAGVVLVPLSSHVPGVRDVVGNPRSYGQCFVFPQAESKVQGAFDVILMGNGRAPQHAHIAPLVAEIHSIDQSPVAHLQIEDRLQKTFQRVLRDFRDPQEQMHRLPELPFQVLCDELLWCKGCRRPHVDWRQSHGLGGWQWAYYPIQQPEVANRLCFDLSLQQAADFFRENDLARLGLMLCQRGLFHGIAPKVVQSSVACARSHDSPCD